MTIDDAKQALLDQIVENAKKGSANTTQQFVDAYCQIVMAEAAACPGHDWPEDVETPQ